MINLSHQQLQTSPEYGQGMNPISRLAQIQQAKKEKEPEYSMVTERGLPRRREFVMQVIWRQRENAVSIASSGLPLLSASGDCERPIGRGNGSQQEGGKEKRRRENAGAPGLQSASASAP